MLTEGENDVLTTELEVSKRSFIHSTKIYQQVLKKTKIVPSSDEHELAMICTFQELTAW